MIHTCQSHKTYQPLCRLCNLSRLSPRHARAFGHQVPDAEVDKSPDNLTLQKQLNYLQAQQKGLVAMNHCQTHEKYDETCLACFVACTDHNLAFLYAQSIPSPSTPGLLTQAGNLTKAVVGHLRQGLPILSPERSQARLEVCRACEKYIPESDRCAVCGCGLSKKATWEDQKCPHPDGDKWKGI